MSTNKQTNLARLAFRFVLTIGIVNLFADFTYEGARSITGPFLGSLGASATVIGIVVGFGELLGYSLRSISGFFADKTHKYWIVAFVGYFINPRPCRQLAHGRRVDYCGTNRTGNQKAFRGSNDFLCRQRNRARLGVWAE